MAITSGKITAGNDTLLGSSGIDTIKALTGDDMIDGLAGNDLLYGEDGSDLLYGGVGDDQLWGGNNNDVLDGSDGNDKLYGDAGDDALYGAVGVDSLFGGLGNDYLAGQEGNDLLFGQGGADLLMGGDGDDIIVDTTSSRVYGDDSLAAQADELLGGAGNDTMYGGFDTIDSGEGNDIIYLKGRGEVLGGVGNDIVTLNNTNAALSSLLDGGFGNDKITGGSGNDTLVGGSAKIETVDGVRQEVLGHGGKDTLIGGAGNDEYHLTFDNALFGTDVVTEAAGGGTDTVVLHYDHEQSLNESGLNTNYTMANEVENAIIADLEDPVSKGETYWIAQLNGNTLNNKLTGSALSNSLNGGIGNDTVFAGAENDRIYINSVGDSVDGGTGVDLLVSDINVDLSKYTSIENVQLSSASTALNITAGSGNNVLAGNSLSNVISAGAGNDTLIAAGVKSWSQGKSISQLMVDDTKAGGGVDTLIGGEGNDLYYVDDALDQTREARATGGIDKVIVTGNADLTNGVASSAVVNEARGFYNLQTGIENLELKSSKTHNAAGNELNNNMLGNDNANILRSGWGADTLDGDKGADSLEGGYGDDIYYIDHGSDKLVQDKVVEVDNQGENDEVRSTTGSIDLGSEKIGDVEHAMLLGSGNYNLTGDHQNNRLTGNDGKNELRGGLGNDTLAGGKGDDTYFVSSQTEDTLIESYESATAGQNDMVVSDVTFTLAGYGEIEHLQLAGATAINGTGNAKSNIITGNSAINTLNGGQGNDTLVGGGGIDTLIGGEDDDTYELEVGVVDRITELVGQGIDTIKIAGGFNLSSSSDYSNIENLELTGTSNNIDATGNALNNKLTGNSFSNKLYGLTGNDALLGGGGADVLVGGKGADFYDLKAGESSATADTVIIAAGDSVATDQATSDKIINFQMGTDKLDLFGTTALKVAANTGATDGADVGPIKSHQISNGIIKFDDQDVFASAVSVTSTNLNSVLDYLKTNIADGQTVAFSGVGTGSTQATDKFSGSSTWLFTAGTSGGEDQLIELVGLTATSVSSSWII